jgi:hypothetical protein
MVDAEKVVDEYLMVDGKNIDEWQDVGMADDVGLMNYGCWDSWWCWMEGKIDGGKVVFIANEGWWLKM